MRDIPQDPALDASLALLEEGYRFIGDRCDRFGSDIFAARIMLTKAIFLRGAEAASMFYTPGRFTRVGAMPQTVLRLLQDKGSVQMLDGAAHRHRRAAFLSLMDEPSLRRATTLLEQHWRGALPGWSAAGEIVLLEAMSPVLTRTACDWAGLRLPEEEIQPLATELAAMVSEAGRIGPRQWRALRLRRRAERRVAKAMLAQRASGDVAPGSALEAFLQHRDLKGEPLPPEVLAVEMLNILRPILAVGRYMVFAALALHDHPAWRARFASGDETELPHFVQEVRRFYPFFPAIGGRVRECFTWRGHDFTAGDWVLLDLYGTNHDARLWPEPERFRPERFRNWSGDANSLIPQGAGDRIAGHRCPGEDLTILLVMQAVRLLSRMRCVLPPQDLSIDLATMPASPASGLVLGEISPELPPLRLTLHAGAHNAA
ncbi:cytochrome P450 [Pseudoroseomonas cervicalis]|uniref:Fatty-acid peroxygenase n=1 Tax=Pseudoroseomonas cervicalis ATCC 49957 TaxID=525371 RepID=D5RJG2_9PROT|nr:hypothetical protein HMPREF0731_1222 [Pseudoroseomonas cervicalis ATCC 49957]